MLCGLAYFFSGAFDGSFLCDSVSNIRFSFVFNWSSSNQLHNHKRHKHNNNSNTFHLRGTCVLLLFLFFLQLLPPLSFVPQPSLSCRTSHPHRGRRCRWCTHSPRHLPLHPRHHAQRHEQQQEDIVLSCVRAAVALHRFARASSCDASAAAETRRGACIGTGTHISMREPKKSHPTHQQQRQQWK